MRIALLLLLCLTALRASATGSAEFNEAACSRVDVRPKLEKLGWPRAPHMGGRPDSQSLAFSEALSLKLGAALSPLDLDRELAKGTSIEEALALLVRSGVCPLSEAPMDDLAFSRNIEKPERKIQVPQSACERHPERRQPLSGISFSRLETTAKDIDRSLDDGRLPIAAWETPAGRLHSPIEARRFSAKRDGCEWLVRMMNGPFCDSKIEGTCEDGALWISREEFLKSVRAAWEVR